MSDPIVIILAIVFVIIALFLLTLICCYLYNALSNKMYGVMLGLDKENNMTVINNINPVNAALILSILGLVIGVIYGIILFATMHSLYWLIGSILIGFIGTFLCVLISSYLYNLLAPKLGKIKIELTDIE
jgi:MFS family permease